MVTHVTSRTAACPARGRNEAARLAALEDLPMADYNQDSCLLALTTPLGPDALLPVSLFGTEAASRLFEFELELVASIGPPLSFNRILGQAVSLSCARATAAARSMGSSTASAGPARATPSRTTGRACHPGCDC
jgi:hypothetical protein